MRARRRFDLGVLLGLALSLAVAGSGCQKGTYLEVRFLGDGLPEVWSIILKLTLTPPSGGPKTVTQTLAPPQSGQAFHFPTSMALKMDDDSGTLDLEARALDASGADLAIATNSTTVMHDKTWQIDLDFTGAGTGADAGGVQDAGATDDGSIIINDDAGIVVTDGSIADGTVGCAAVTLYAIDSVTLDYESSGPTTDYGNMLSAALGGNRNTVGWVKFNLRLVPRAAVVTGADLRLVLSQTLGSPANLSVQYSTFDDWTRANAATNTLMGTATISGELGAPKAGPNLFALTTNQTTGDGHDWSADLADGVVTIGIRNTSGSGDQGSAADFFGVDHVMQPVGTRPALNLSICR